MGCDIHVMVERQSLHNGQLVWMNCDNWRLNEYFGTDDGERKFLLEPLYGSRDYELFSFLANVRNYGGNQSFGFDRGIPEDAHAATREEYERWGCDAHTPGYCTLKELKEAVSGVEKVRREGAVAKEEADRYRATGQTPDSWCQGVGCWKGIAPAYADKYEWLVWEDEVHCFDKLIAAIEDRKRDVFWYLQPEKEDGSCDDKIRIVFWFDN